jgi:hypothetical protein
VDFVESNPGSFNTLQVSYKPSRLEELSLDDRNAEAVITAALDGPQYHALCFSHPMAHYRWLSVSTQLLIQPKTEIYRFNSQNETWFRITKSLRHDRQNPVWYDLTDDIHPDPDLGEVLPNSWTRYFTFDTGYFPPLNFLVFFSRYNASLTSQRHLWVRLIKPQSHGSESWLAQVNHIFTQLEETAHSEDYGTIKFDSSIFNDPRTQFAYQQSISVSDFCPMLATLTNQMVTCLFVHLRTSELDRIYFGGQIVPPIGRSIHLEPPASAPRMRKFSDFPLFTSKLIYWDLRGIAVFMTDYDNFIEAKDSTQTAKRPRYITVTRYMSSRVRRSVHWHVVSLVRSIHYLPN